jgi:dTMP kinase
VLITVEGLDGAGKTTLVTGLAAALRARGFAVTVLREPGGVEVSERIRSLVVDPALDVDPRAEALLYAAARAQLVASKLRPLLEAGEWVLLDRFVDSSLAYQGGGRGLGIDAVRALNSFAVQGVKPDLTLLLRIDPERGLARLAGEGDRLERAGVAFFRAVAAAYDELAALEPSRFVVLDASLPAPTVLAEALSAVTRLAETGERPAG